jgi:hypothetical protein
VKTEDGYLRFMAASPSQGQAKSRPGNFKPGRAAHSALQRWRRVLMKTSAAIEFDTVRTRRRDNRHYMHLRQTYDSIEVFGARVMVARMSWTAASYLPNQS